MEYESKDSSKHATLSELAEVNDKLSRTNTGIVLSTVANIIICLATVLLAFLAITIATGSQSKYDFSMLPAVVSTPGLLILILPFLFTAALIILLAARELTLRQGRVLFEFLGERSHKFHRDNIQIGNDIEDQSYIQIKLFAINEGLPLVRGSATGPMVYLTLNVFVAMTTYMVLWETIRILTNS